MARFAFLHAADLHLDAPFRGIGRAPADVAAALRDASVDTWDTLVDLAIARDVAALLLAGGLCDGLERGVRAQARLRDGLRRLAAHGIRVCIAPSPSDPLAAMAAALPWPDGVTVFDAAAPAAVAIVRDGTALATVFGAGPPDAAPAPREAGAAPAALRIGLLHAALDDPDAGACARYSVEALRAAGVDYWALGHAHEHSERWRGEPWIVYPGTPQGRAVDERECGPKGAVLVEVEDGAVRQVVFEPLDRVRCLRLECTAIDDPAALAPTLTARAAALRALHPGRGLLLAARVGGAPAVARALRHPDARQALLRALRRATADWEPFVWWVGLAPVATTAAEERGELAGEVRRQRAALAEDPARGRRFLSRRFEPLRDAWTADVDAPEAAELLDEAAAVAIDALDAAEHEA